MSDAVEDRRQDQQNPAIFAELAKISLELRKFHMFSENFASSAKLCNFAIPNQFR